MFILQTRTYCKVKTSWNRSLKLLKCKNAKILTYILTPRAQKVNEKMFTLRISALPKMVDFLYILLIPQKISDNFGKLFKCTWKNLMSSVKIETVCPWGHLVAQVSYARSHYRLRYLRLVESKENLLQLHINNLNWSKGSLALFGWNVKTKYFFISWNENQRVYPGQISEVYFRELC